MRSRTCALIGAVMLLSGCASAEPNGGTKVSLDVVPAEPAATTSPMGLLRPTPAQEQEMAAALLVIDARMDNLDRYVGRTVDTCVDIRQGEITGDALVARVQQRFSGGTMPDFTPGAGSTSH